MEPEKFNKKKMDDLFNQVFSFSVPINTYKFNLTPPESVEDIVARLDNVDETVDAMTSYPTAERMLNDLFNKDK